MTLAGSGSIAGEHDAEGPDPNSGVAKHGTRAGAEAVEAQAAPNVSTREQIDNGVAAEAVATPSGIVPAGAAVGGSDVGTNRASMSGSPEDGGDSTEEAHPAGGPHTSGQMDTGSTAAQTLTAPTGVATDVVSEAHGGVAAHRASPQGGATPGNAERQRSTAPGIAAASAALSAPTTTPASNGAGVSKGVARSDPYAGETQPGSAAAVSPTASVATPDVSRETPTAAPVEDRHAAEPPADSADTTDVLAGSAPAYVGDVSRETDFDTPIAREAARALHVLNPSGARRLPRPSERRILTIANQKGGVGKTTSTVNLAVALGLHGVRVLVIDLDPQGNASTGLSVPHQQGTPSIYDVLVNGSRLIDVAAPVEVSPLVHCAPATIDLAGAEIELVTLERRESRLKQAIDEYAEEVDYVLIDCPPSLGLLTVNAFVAANEVLIPIQCEYYALEGLGQLLNNIELVTAHLNPKLSVSTILLTMYDGRTKLADQVAAEVREHFGERVLRSVIPRSVRVSEAPGFGQSVITYDPGSRGALSYLDAAEELAQRGVTDNSETTD